MSDHPDKQWAEQKASDVKELAREIAYTNHTYDKLTGAIATARQAERDRADLAEHRLNNLLCRIHRDGGHYLHQHGVEKACHDADEKVAKLNAESDRAVCDTITSIGDAAEQIVELKATLEECRRVLGKVQDSMLCEKCHRHRNSHVFGMYCSLGDPDADVFTVNMAVVEAINRDAATLLAKLTP